MIRIVENVFPTLTNLIEQDRQNVNTAIREIATGQDVNQLSDNPSAAALLVDNRAETAAVDQFQHSITTIQGRLQTADSALNSVIQDLTQAIALGTEGANGTLSSAERNAVAQQVTNLQQDVLGLANSTYQGSYIFAGTAVTAAPYVVDPTSPSGVRYVGNAKVNDVEVGLGQSVPVNLPGSTIFNGAGADVFQALHDLTTALQTNGNIPAATAEVKSAFDNISQQRTFYGATLQRLDAASSNLSQEAVTLATIQNDLISADPAQAASDLSQAVTTLDATLAAFGKVTQNTLMDYIR